MNRKTGSLARSLIISAFACCSFGLLAGSAHAGTIAYWDFNDSLPSQPANLIVDQGAGTLTSNVDDPTNNLTHFTGTSLGALAGPPPASNEDLAVVAGAAMINNGRYITFAINTTGLARIQLSFATQRSSSGFDSVQISYSTNGDAGPFTNFGAAYLPPDAYELKVFDFGALLDNNANIRVRLTFDGATGPTGNNRLDNIRFYTGNGACCKPDNSCVQTTRADCLQTLLGVYAGEDSVCGTCPLSYPNVVFNEIRSDQLGIDFDEYVELSGDPTTSLNGLSVVVIGDGQAAQLSGVIEFVRDLSGYSIPADGRFFMAGDDNTFGLPPDLLLGLSQDIFENLDNVTFLLVSGFRGAVGDDLDTDDDCILNSTPWVTELDRVALVISQSENPGLNTECHYGETLDQIIGPDEFETQPFQPSYLYRYDANQNPKDGIGRPWIIGQKNVALGDDTPGTSNAPAMGACCNLSLCTFSASTNCNGEWKGRNTTCDGNPCIGACCDYDTPGNCVITNETVCGQHAGGYQGDRSTCPCLPCLTLAQVRSMVVGTATFSRFGARVCDVQVINKTDLISSGSSRNFQIMDTTGPDGRSALTVFATNSVIEAALTGVNLGDRIKLQGTVGRFRGLLEFEDVPSQTPIIRFGPNLGTGPAIIPLVVPLSWLVDHAPEAETIESEVIKVNCVAFLDGDGTSVFSATQPANYLITDGTSIAIMRVALGTFDFAGQLIPTGPVNITGIMAQFDSSTAGGTPDHDDLDVYEIEPRKFNPPGNEVEAASGCGPTGACCLQAAAGGAICRTTLTQALCLGVGGLYRGDGVACGSPATNPPSSCPTTDGIVINEVRLQQPEAGGDVAEYFELKGPPNTPIGSLTYITLGDNTGANPSGIIETVLPLKGKRINANGFFLVTESTYNLGGTPDYMLPATPANPLNFENDDNVTHMLVEGFYGTNGSDLDTDDDGDLDVTPWTRILSIVSPVVNITRPPVAPNEWWYGPTVGPVPGNFVPGHVIRCPGALNDYIIGSYAAAGGNDTPGDANNCLGACFSCPGDLDNSLVADINDMDEFVAALLDITPNPCADINLNNATDSGDIRGFLQLITAPGNLGTSCLPISQRTVVRCDNAVPPCAIDSGVWCLYMVDAGQAGPCIATPPNLPTPNQLAPGNTICVRCTGPGSCGAPAGSKAQIVWQNWDGTGNDCTFIASLTSANCTTCAGGNKRFTTPPLPPQIKLVAYNLLNYTSGREAEFKTILNAINPDVVVCSEVVGTTGKDNFLNNVLNGVGGPGGFTTAEFTNGSDTDNAFYFRTTRVTYALGDHITLPTSPRLTDRWKVSLTGYPASPANDMYVYSGHFKAGTATDDPQNPVLREAQAAAIRADTNALPDNSNIIVAGDFNLYSSSEGGYARLIESQVDNSGRLFDPINSPGSWTANFNFRAIHTQSPHNNNTGAPAGASTGGMDDRFDFQLISSALNDGLGLTYKPGTYKAFGNDSNHYNQDINDPPVIPEGQPMADALHGASDHLPVVMELLLP